MQKPQVIFFDWNGTLSNSFFWEHLRISEKQEDLDKYSKWDKSLFSNSKDYINTWMRGDITTEEILRNVAESTQSDYEEVLKEFIHGCESMTLSSQQLPNIFQKLRQKGIKIVIATNNMDCFDRWTVPAMKLNLMFDEIINSYNRHSLKHEGKFFTSFFNSNKEVDATKCVFFDDSNDKENYISNLGINYIKIPNSEALPKLLESYI